MSLPNQYLRGKAQHPTVSGSWVPLSAPVLWNFRLHRDVSYFVVSPEFVWDRILNAVRVRLGKLDHLFKIITS
jgi:hypothetical protein